jgi:hypothetical protein
VLETEKVFITSIQQPYMIMLPFNLPPQQIKTTDLPNQLFTFAKYFSGNEAYEPLRQKTSKNRNIWIPASLYWDQRP